MTDKKYNTVSQTETVDAQEDIENNSKKVIFRTKAVDIELIDVGHLLHFQKNG